MNPILTRSPPPSAVFYSLLFAPTPAPTPPLPSASPPAPTPPTRPSRPPSPTRQQLNDMGFSNAAQNVRALLATGGNVHSAIEYILGGGGL
ncbi:hypothetical protein D9615_007800 [Tricholomella constricta]|uniref:UBA domain-containing protein n=1 Tax=Tricholomella constricta TaxID=117010 RepID=A0A8H5H4V6_9AGAR|nr:hypothetical protein D9615_007800 [Tricholomella constricta]